MRGPMDFQFLRNCRPALWFVIALGILVRIGIKMLRVDFHDPDLFENGKTAALLLATGQYTMWHPGLPTAFVPPGFTLLIAGVFACFGQGVGGTATLVVLTILFEVSTPFLVGAVARVIWGDRAARLALVLALFWPNLLLVSGRLHAISLYQPILVAIVWLASTTAWTPARRALGIGMLLGVFVNLRFDSPLYLIPAVLLLATRTPDRWRPLRPLRSTLGLTALVAAMLAVGAAPWLVRNWIAFGQPVYSTQGGVNLLRGHHPTATGTGRDVWDEVEAEGGDHNVGTRIAAFDSIDAALAWTDPGDEITENDACFRAAFAYVVTHPRAEVTLTARKLYYFLVADFTHPAARRPVVWVPSLIVLLLALVFLARTRPRDPRQWVLVLVFLVQLMVAVVFYAMPRYRILVDWVPLLFAAAWLASLPLGAKLDGLLGPASRAASPPAPRR